ncbi:hypothetical protein ART_0193 [Arthrobacter sp. PAMC 25486]|uniref:hypothetical protein n=1 Tax=Arthrobacter sp. PAMC 25486 TaxID=1494608 RepID=UPI0005363728|nr:hypothetical protein [Arthrobacter sp. PAMC 25486]AIX99791.1 hypothetical protein ART_0193 [Arthrobacter sp. PAMC 25486]
MKSIGTTRAEIVAGTHLSSRALGKKLNYQSVLNIRDFFAIARILDVSPSSLIAAAESR